MIDDDSDFTDGKNKEYGVNAKGTVLELERIYRSDGHGGIYNLISCLFYYSNRSDSSAPFPAACVHVAR